jgi:hypothetical protein
MKREERARSALYKNTHHESTKGRKHESRETRTADSTGLFGVFLRRGDAFFALSSFRAFVMGFLYKAGPLSAGRAA